MSSVRLLDVTKRFGTVTAVSDLSLVVENGEFFSLLGPSGCGKTTILRMIAGFSIPSTGEIFFHDRNISALPPNKRNTGMVFQNYALFPHMTVFENVAFGLRARKVPRVQRQERVMKALELVNLHDLEKRSVAQLSGGQQQRVALARAIVIEPEILLLDEPLSNLDAKLRRETRDQIQKLQRELGITTIYVTHDQEEALTLSDRIALLDRGVCQQIGTPQEIYNNPANAFVASFIGRSNLMKGTVIDISADMALVESEGGIQLHVSRAEIGSERDREDGIGKRGVGKREDVLLALRPEGITLRKEKSSRRNCFKGVIKLRQFNGYAVEYEVGILGVSLNVIALNEDKNIFNIQDEVYVEIPEDRISVISASHEDAGSIELGA